MLLFQTMVVKTENVCISQAKPHKEWVHRVNPQHPQQSITMNLKPRAGYIVVTPSTKSLPKSQFPLQNRSNARQFARPILNRRKVALSG